MKKQIAFSVVLPLYNKEASISKTIESVLDQSCSDLELIIVNDGSTDSSLEMVNKFSDSRIIVYSQRNQGVSVARNKGIELAQFDYLAFIDGDDLWHRDYLKIMSSMIKENPEAACFSAAWSASSVLSQISNEQVKFNANEVCKINYVKESRKDVVANICSVVAVRDAAISVGGFPDGVKILEDQEFCCKLSRLGNFVHYNKALVFYMRDAENRACDNRRVQDMPPYFQKSEPVMLSKHKPNSYEWHFKEYLIAKYLSECAFASTISGEKARAVRWWWLCKHTEASRLRFIKTGFYLLMPASFLKITLGAVSVFNKFLKHHQKKYPKQKHV